MLFDAAIVDQRLESRLGREVVTGSIGADLSDEEHSIFEFH